MKAPNTYTQYQDYKKPRWAPPVWVFAPVWTLLYLLIAISFGFVGNLFVRGSVPIVVLAPFVFNLLCNFAFTPLQFRLQNFFLATLDILGVLATLIWALIVIFPIAPWVAYANIPYLLWVCFATILQITVTLINKK